jgi:hypothetical protein
MMYGRGLGGFCELNMVASGFVERELPRASETRITSFVDVVHQIKICFRI